MSFLKRHSLSLVAGAVTIAWLVCYALGDPGTKVGSFYGNAVADWTGVVVTVLATKYLYEAGGRKKEIVVGPWWLRVCRNHMLTVFLVVTGVGWVVVYAWLPAENRWGQVAGNMVSEWTQNLAFVWLTKEFIERGARRHREEAK